VTSFRLHPDVLARKVGDEMVLVHAARNNVFSLNRTGARLWELLSEGRTRAEAVEQLAAEFEVARETVEHEAVRLLAKLEREGLIERGE
jgi:hypothetical protein